MYVLTMDQGRERALKPSKETTPTARLREVLRAPNSETRRHRVDLQGVANHRDAVDRQEEEDHQDEVHRPMANFQTA